MRRRHVLMAVAVLVVAACTGDGDEAGGPQTPTRRLIEVSATEYSFDVPAEVTGGVVSMRLANTGGLPHEFAFGRIEEGKTEADVKAVIESGREPPRWFEDVAGVPGLSPGESTIVTRTLEPGAYVFLCFFPDPEGTPHALLGMYEVFTISGDTGAALPEPDAVITATEDGLEIPALSAGEQVIEFRNEGTKPHELILVTFEAGKTVEDVDEWIESGYPGEPPVTFLGGMQTIPAGASVFLTIELEPGVEYTAADFTGDHMETFTAA
ncbi:MAG TPA: hypothetical protein VJ259_07520 [Actinomycetota bacterium]|nr:hypothetical protein [Actinomycetota bacterium]